MKDRLLQERAREMIARHEKERLDLIEDALKTMLPDAEIEREIEQVRVRKRNLGRSLLSPDELRFFMERMH
jgi:hypothetical protein